jgi:Uma2 family endonuclease
VIAEPVIIIEVMSPSSVDDDTGRKWLSYRKIASLKHYIVLAQDQRLVHVHSRAGDLWRERFIGTGSLSLEDPPLCVDLDTLYAGAELAA